jgi:TolB protein
MRCSAPAVRPAKGGVTSMKLFAVSIQRQCKRQGCLAMLIGVVVATSAISVVPAYATVPGRNGRVIYWNTVGGGELGRNQVFTIRPDGTGRRRLTYRGESDSPDWAPHGHRIVYRHWSKDGHSSIWIMGEHGHHKHPLVPRPRRANDSDPAWAPGGQRIVFVRFSGVGDQDLIVYSLRSHKTRQLHVGHGFSAIPSAPAWSPDGGTIAFTVLDKSDPNASEQWPDLFTVRPDGSHLAQLTRTPKWEEDSPDWSPSGRLLAYGRAFGGVCEEQIALIRSNGTERRRVRAGCSAGSPAWAPNGRRMLIGAVYGERAGIWIIRLSGRHRHYVAAGADGHWQPVTD